MAGREVDIVVDDSDLNDFEQDADAPESAGSEEDGPGSPECSNDCSTAVDLSQPSSRLGLKINETGISTFTNCRKLIKKGSAISNSFIPQSFVHPLEESSQHCVEVLAAVDYSLSADKDIQEEVEAPLEPRSSSGTIHGEITQDDAKRSLRNKKRVPDVQDGILYCTFCDYSCTLKRTLNVHLLKHDSSKQFTCSDCTYKTSRSSDLKKHVRIHSGEKPFKCELCDYKSTEQGALRKHMLTHNCDNPHSCPNCDYVSPRIGDLKRHMHVHSDKKPYACQQCDYKTSQLPRLRRHMLVHTGQKPYQCTYCDYRCREPRNLKTHIQTHTGEKPYGCPHCQYKAGRLGRLRRHIARIHPQEDPLARAKHFLDGSDDQDEQSAQVEVADTN